MKTYATQRSRQGNMWTDHFSYTNPQPFNTNGAVTGRTGSGGRGELPEDYWKRYVASEATFTIYSYDTPIAWRGKDGYWVVPDVFYSPTTSRHQSAVRRCVGEFFAVSA